MRDQAADSYGICPVKKLRVNYSSRIKIDIKNENQTCWPGRDGIIPVNPNMFQFLKTAIYKIQKSLQIYNYAPWLNLNKLSIKKSKNCNQIENQIII